MKWLQAIQKRLPKHKYAINAKLLGDQPECAWTNLGYWDDATSSYPQACQQLAQQLAQQLHLNAEDRVLDLGCGQGASLKYWLEHYQIQNLTAVELQSECVEKCLKNIQQHSPRIKNIYCQSFLNLETIQFQQYFDVVMCIDAAYHSDLNLFLKSAISVLNSNGRLGFHYLMLSEHTLSSKQKLKYHYMLKAADVNFDHLMTRAQLQQTLHDNVLHNIEIQDISDAVLLGFSQYIGSLSKTQKSSLDLFKIQMTAKLCKTLFEDGIVRYAQISGQKK